MGLSADCGGTGAGAIGECRHRHWHQLPCLLFDPLLLIKVSFGCVCVWGFGGECMWGGAVRGRGTFVDESGTSVTAHECTLFPRGVHSPFGADRLHIQSFPEGVV